MSADTLSFQRVTLLKAADCPSPVLDHHTAHTAANCVHSILLAIPKPEKDQPGIEQAWKFVAPGLQLRAQQAGGVKTLYENCWLIPAEENGLLFFDHAIAVADGLKLRCRICVLRTPSNGFAHPSPEPRLKHLPGTTARTFLGTVRRVLELLARRGLAC